MGARGALSLYSLISQEDAKIEYIDTNAHYKSFSMKCHFLLYCINQQLTIIHLLKEVVNLGGLGGYGPPADLVMNKIAYS